MSALIAILALSQLALDRGSGLQPPFAITIIFGLTAGAPLVFLVLPAICPAAERPEDFQK